MSITRDLGLIKGSNGTTFTPYISQTGELSWSNDGGLPNPRTVVLVTDESAHMTADTMAVENNSGGAFEYDTVQSAIDSTVTSLLSINEQLTGLEALLAGI